LTPQPHARRLAPIVPPRLSAADMLRALADASDGEKISVDEILTALGNHSFGLLILVLALPNAIPGPIIPGFSVPFAVGIILLGIQISQGHKRPLLPSWLRRRAVKRERFRRFVARADPFLRRFERWFKPRPARFLKRDEERPRALGFILVLYALVLALPIPLGNGPEAFAICVVGLGMFEADEKVQSIGIALGLAATLINAAIVVAGVQIFTHAVKLLG
jgi:hypothetical protein